MSELTLSVSKISRWLTCKADYRAKYILGVDVDKDNEHLLMGSHIHEQIEKYHLGLDHDSEWINEYKMIYPPDKASEIEFRFEVDFTHPLTGELLGSSFRGIIDRLTDNGIYDVKTASKSIEATKVNESLGKPGYHFYDSYGLQATAYSYYVWQAKHKILPVYFPVIRKDLKKNGERFPVKTLRTERTLFDFAMFWELCHDVINEIENERLYMCECVGHTHEMFEVAK